MTDLPTWPAKMTREQQRSNKERSKVFYAALKLATRASGWRYVRSDVFQQTDDWFISILPSLLWERGVTVQMTIKPMALDPLFWDIVGLSENKAQPLSFRATGAWTLRPPFIIEHVGLDVSEVELLANDVLRWGNQKSREMLKTISVKSMIAALRNDEQLRGQPRALAVCLHILAGNLDDAMRLCRIDDPDTHPLHRVGGGFTTSCADGSARTFLDQAREWIDRFQE